jgi:hypothetical protein
MKSSRRGRHETGGTRVLVGCADTNCLHPTRPTRPPSLAISRRRVYILIIVFVFVYGLIIYGYDDVTAVSVTWATGLTAAKISRNLAKTRILAIAET